MYAHCLKEASVVAATVISQNPYTQVPVLHLRTSS